MRCRRPGRGRGLLLVGLIGALVSGAPWTGRAAEPDEGRGASVERALIQAADVFPIRFGGFLRLVVGGVFLVPATIFSALTYPFERNPEVFGNNAELYVLEPFDYTFRRPLGEDLGG